MAALLGAPNLLFADKGKSALKGAVIGGLTGAAIGGIAGGGPGAGIGAASGIVGGALIGSYMGDEDKTKKVTISDNSAQVARLETKRSRLERQLAKEQNRNRPSDKKIDRLNNSIHDLDHQIDDLTGAKKAVVVQETK